VKLLPEFTMASALSLLRPQLADGRWHIARTVVREQGAEQPLGVLLFCYPDALIPQLANEARSTMWRSRLTRGLTEAERQKLGMRLSGPLRDVSITAPVTIHQHMTLGMLNALERGDVVAFDEDHVGDIRFSVLGREVTGRLAAHGDRLALALSGPSADAPMHEMAPPEPQAMPDPVDFGGVYGEQPAAESSEGWMEAV
jgi:hypothetical protein